MPRIPTRARKDWNRLESYLLALLQDGHHDLPMDVYNAFVGLNYYFHALSSHRRCAICHEREAVWAKQYIGSDTPEYYRLGYHIRGFAVVKLCEECRQAEEVENANPY